MQLIPGTGFLLERHLRSDARFVPHLGFAGERYYDFGDVPTGERREGLLTNEAVRLKIELEMASGRN
jgi:hypothetical protein